MDWYKGLSEQEIKMYKQMRKEQQKAKKKGVTAVSYTHLTLPTKPKV